MMMNLSGMMSKRLPRRFFVRLGDKGVCLWFVAKGYIHSYIDFFYIVNDTIPINIHPGPKYLEEVENNMDKRKHYESESEDKLKELMNKLT